MTVVSDSRHQSTLDAVYVYVMPRSEFPIVPEVDPAWLGVYWPPQAPSAHDPDQADERMLEGLLGRSPTVHAYTCDPRIINPFIDKGPT